MPAVKGADLKPVPQGFVTKPLIARLETVATLTVTMSATVPAILTDADAWGTAYQNILAGAGGFVIDLVAGTIKVPRAMDVRVDYSFSGITVINGAVRVAQVYGGAAGTTAKGGLCQATDLTAGPTELSGFAIFACAAGDILSIKAIESTAGSMVVLLGAGSFTVTEV